MGKYGGLGGGGGYGAGVSGASAGGIDTGSGYGVDTGGGAGGAGGGGGAYDSLNSGFGGGGGSGLGAGGALSGASPIGGYGGTNLSMGGTPGNLVSAGNPSGITQNLFDQAPSTNLGGQNTGNIAQNFQGFTSTPDADPITSAGGQISGQGGQFSTGWSGGPGATVESPGTGLAPSELSAADQAEAAAFNGTAPQDSLVGSTVPATPADTAQYGLNQISPSQAQISAATSPTGSFGAGATPVDTTGMMSVGPAVAGNIPGPMPAAGADPFAGGGVQFGSASPAVDPTTGAPTTVAAQPALPAPATVSTAGAPAAAPAPTSTAGSAAAVTAQQANTNAIPGAGGSQTAGGGQIAQALASMGLSAGAIAMLGNIFRNLAQHENPQLALAQILRMIQQRGGAGPWGANQGNAGAWGGMRPGQPLIPGQVITGQNGQRYRYAGGDPRQQTSWSPVTGNASGAPSSPPSSSASNGASAPASQTT